MNTTKTYSPKLADLKPRWQVIDAEGEILGRLASRIAQLLKGKHNPLYSPHMLSGDYVIVVNAGKVVTTGNNKERQKRYYRHSGYPGGFHSLTLQQMQEKHPERILEHAVKGMLPHSPIGRVMMRRLKIYLESNHPHESQIRGQENSES